MELWKSHILLIIEQALHDLDRIATCCEPDHDQILEPALKSARGFFHRLQTDIMKMIDIEDIQVVAAKLTTDPDDISEFTIKVPKANERLHRALICLLLKE